MIFFLTLCEDTGVVHTHIGLQTHWNKHVAQNVRSVTRVGHPPGPSRQLNPTNLRTPSAPTQHLTYQRSQCCVFQMAHTRIQTQHSLRIYIFYL